ncbi:uncharacterized protein RJT20DRAFT_137618 [Scheffersomyces xylosifermentans]|uniref:uncharacterized protein n=1 Tax=Scheffersomyces xylosifermentans TaxID=1304137 RepID=UPI00315CB9BB
MSFRIWRDIEFKGKSDVADAFNELFEPLVPTFSPGGARVRLAETGSSCSTEAAELEGFSRLLWGIVPYVYGGGDFKYWDLYRRGVANGTNPQHQEFWGYPHDVDQRLVDIAAVAFALCFTPQHLWDPLSENEKSHVSTYLQISSKKEFCHTNWKFFKILIDLALERLGFGIDKESHVKYLSDLESMYLDNGWYGDGKTHRIDYYNAVAFHFYSMVYVHFKKRDDPQRCARFLSRAKLFSKQYVHWFADDGSALPYGRSLIYRFVSVGFWGILPLVLDSREEPPISWGVMKGVYLRNLKWWSKQPLCFFGSKLLTLGYSYPNALMTERYNAPQSPYWAFKGFSGLFVSESHPFWTSEIEPLKLCDTFLEVIGMKIYHRKFNTTALINGPWNDEFQTEKYTKFAYSTRYGFGVVTNHRTFALAHLDNMIGFSFNKKEFFVRDYYQPLKSSNYLISKWSPVQGIEIESVIITLDNFHKRIHYIKNNTEYEVHTREGGFAIPSSYKATVLKTTSDTDATVSSEDDYSSIVDLGGNRVSHVCEPEPNSNILYSKVLLPQLCGSIPPKGTVKYSSAVFATPIYGDDFEFDNWLTDTSLPSDNDLERAKLAAKPVPCNPISTSTS